VGVAALCLAAADRPEYGKQQRYHDDQRYRGSSELLP